MTDTERKYPLSDADLLTATDDELHADWRTRARLQTGAAAAQRDAIVRAATAKVRAEYEAHLATARTDGAREAARKAWDAASSHFTKGDLPPSLLVLNRLSCAARDSYLAREYPFPAPREEAVTLSDGSVVRLTTNGAGAVRLAREGRRGVWMPQDWRAMLLDSDTGADFDALKDFGARVAGREP